MPHIAMKFCLICILIYFATTASADEKTVITYNAGLFESIGLGKVPNRPSRVDRRDAIIRELKNPENDADAVCLQEVYMGEDIDEIMEEVASVYPYSFSAIHDTEGNLPLDGLDTTPACGYWWYQRAALNRFTSCVESYCDNIQSVGEAIDCIGANCWAWYTFLSQECANCIIMTWPDAARVRQKFDGLGTIVCTHLIPPLSASYPEYQIMWNEGINSYVEQNAVEHRKLVMKFGSTSTVLILGDFNVGETIEPENYEIMTAAFQTHLSDECTYCNTTEIPYNGNGRSLVIDHIFYKGATYIEGSSERVFNNASVGGYPLSDHFGLKQSFRI